MTDNASSPQDLDTLPKLLDHNARVRGAKMAIREKDFGIWQSWTWSQMADHVRALACGLKDMGLNEGDKVVVCGDNRPNLYSAMTAIQAAGGIPVPVYQDSVAEEMQYIYEHAEARFAIVENQEQVDKVLEIKDNTPKLEQVIFGDPRGLRNYAQTFIQSYASVQERGRAFDQSNPSFYGDSVASKSGADTSIMLYTSGTTGRPKGVMLSYDNMIITGRNCSELEGLGDDDSILAYLPMAWIGDNIFSHAQSYVTGYCVNCPENSDTVLEDLREIGPSYFFAPPRIFENILTTVMIRMEDAAKIKQRMFHYFMDVAKRVGLDILDGKPVSFGDRLLYKIGDILVYAPLKNVLGLSNVSVAYTGGVAIGPDIFIFYRSLGLNLKQIYASTEAAVFITIQRNGEVNPETSGKPALGVELNIADDGEVLFRSPGVFQAYFKDDEATKETKTDDGWVHTGDAGFIDSDGDLRIIDRSKDVGKLNDQSMFAPNFIENKMKFFPHIREAVTFGDGKDYVAAFINIDIESVGNWAERQHLAYSGYTDLAGQDTVYDLIQDCIEQVNADLAADDNLKGSQIRRFLILHKELDADDGELTRTRKVRRNVVVERYDDLIEALYSDKSHCEIDAVVTFEDGRKDTIRADLQIRDAKTADTARAAAE
ncbi:MAG: AMP-binding protein [Rhodospirillaceae bacterium]|nr:AMP-binding protein [Rhodospirillaceae bacterium]MBT3911011.1 AMP-binding protein [Rhodospirillaceae bacterium]MBT6084396.1 AMP-binding protein [Rhodospirillaceae bacterium]MBT6608387.1 AMP-binding protein [Rhodospirillaceae bacterium]MBT6883878.1 AMP-binding protein [Rhodospirillaceae bacterium]